MKYVYFRNICGYSATLLTPNIQQSIGFKIVNNMLTTHELVIDKNISTCYRQ